MSYLQRLVEYHKWRLKDRNVKVGDIVLVLDHKDSKGRFTLREVTSVKTDEDDAVRKVMV